MGEGDAVARPPVGRASLEAELRRIEERQVELDGRRARYAAMRPTPLAWMRRVLDDLDVLAARRDRVGGEWDRLAIERDDAAQTRDTQASEGERAQSGGSDAGLAQTIEETQARAERDREANALDREGAREDRERSALDRGRAGGDRARAKRMRDEQAALLDRAEAAVDSAKAAAVATVDELIAAEEELELAHQLAGALLEQLSLMETNGFWLEQLVSRAEQERGRAQAAGKRAEHFRAQLSELSSMRPIVHDLPSRP